MKTKQMAIAALAALTLCGAAATADAQPANMHRTVVHKTIVHRSVIERPHTVVRKTVIRPTKVVRRTVVRPTTVVRRTLVRTQPVRRIYVNQERVFDVFRARHIRWVGQPYLYDGAYVVRCYGPDGLLEYCRVNPYTGDWLGISIRL